MLEITNLTCRLAGRPILEGASARLTAGARVGIVGANGAGKTTLLRLVLGELEADEGTIRLARDLRIATLPQEAPGGPEPVLAHVLSTDRERHTLLQDAEVATDAHHIADIQTRLADIGAHRAPARAARILAGLGFDSAAQKRPCGDFSGGWRMRIALAATLFVGPDLLLLDEPTNYLDLEGAMWLENYLHRFPGALLVVSHDRHLLNRSVNAILHLHDGRMRLYAGGYDRFLKTRAEQQLQDSRAARRLARERQHIQSFIDRFRAKATKARQAQSRIKMLQRMAAAPTLAGDRHISLEITAGPALASPILRLEEAAVGYAPDTPVLSRLDLTIGADDRIAILGENGNGKSTLAKLLIGQLKPASGRLVKSGRLRIGYFAQHQLDELNAATSAFDHLRLKLPELKESAIRARLGTFGFSGDAANTLTGKLSGGEKARLLIALMAADKPQLLILDEPTNHLDIDTRESLAEALNAFDGAIILISHDRDLIDSCAERLWLVENGEVRRFDGDIGEYEKHILSRRPDRARKADRAANGTPASKQARRRERAEARQQTTTLRRDLKAAEATIAGLERERAAIDRQLAAPEGQDGAPDFAALGRRRGEIDSALARAEESWLKFSTALEGQSESQPRDIKIRGH